MNTSPTEKKTSKRKLYIIFTAVAAVMILIIAVALKLASDSASYTNYYNQGVDCYNAGDYSAALAQLRKAESVNDTDDCHLLMADCYRALGRLDKALEILRAMDSSYPEVAYRMSDIEKAQSAAHSAEMVTINGKEYPLSATSLSLDQSGVNDSTLNGIAQLYSLSTLSLSGNAISNIAPLETLGGLTTLNLSWNTVSDLSPVSSLTELRTLYLDGNPITDFSPLYGLMNLSTLSIKNIAITDEQMDALSAALPNCAMHSDNRDEATPEITLGGYTFSTDVTELDLSDMGLSDISALTACKSLCYLNLSGNSISDLTPLMDIPSLQWLDISYNAVYDLRPLMGIMSLNTVIARYNGIISTVPLGSVSGLVELQLAGNPISNYDGLAKLRQLVALGIENTQLTDEDLTVFNNLTNLRSLNVEDNADLTGNAVDALKERLTGCTISHSKLPYYVELAGQRFLDDITELDLTGANLTDIAVMSSFKNLASIKLGSNSITNIYAFNYMDCSHVTYLDLSGNGLVDSSPLKNFINLETLILTNNGISSISELCQLKNLRTLYIEKNAFTEENIMKLRNALPNCVIYADF